MSIEVYVPDLPESISDATVLTWHKTIGERVQRGENLVDLETDKVVLEVPAPKEGKLAAIHVDTGDIVTAKTLLATLVAMEQSPQQAAINTNPEQSNIKDAHASLSPSVRQLIHQYQLNPDDMTATGKKGRLTKEDVLNYLAQQKPKTQTQAPTETSVAEFANQSRPEQRVPMSRLRAKIAERLVSAQHSAAILTTFNEVNLQAVIDLRKQYQENFQKQHQVKLGFMSFFIKACINALQNFPIVNASIDGNDIIYHGYFDIGVAVSSPRGLVVPILRDADQMSIADIEHKILELADKAKNSTLSYEELQGGTFSISNGGIFGSMLSTPILNPPQSAILGMHSIQQRPIAENGEVVIRPMMYLALSYDHRLIDGRDAVQFLLRIKQNLDAPARLLLNI